MVFFSVSLICWLEASLQERKACSSGVGNRAGSLERQPCKILGAFQTFHIAVQVGTDERSRERLIFCGRYSAKAGTPLDEALRAAAADSVLASRIPKRALKFEVVAGT